MRVRGLPMRFLFLLAACWACASPALAQEQAPSRQGPDVVRVNTSLVQTDVMVFDKQGGFVDGLKREQFVLKVDGKPRDISFFERIVAGSRNEEAQLAAARGNSAGGNTGAVPLDRGRTVFFFVDDLHLSPSSIKQTRLLLQRFIDREMGQNDEAAIASTSGQIGFLQQLTDDKRVLQAATERLLARSNNMAKELDQPPMSEYLAIQIERNDSDVLDYFVDYLLNENPRLARATAEGMVRMRASALLREAAAITTNTLAGLKSLVDTSAALPGRKLLFLISDGFFLDNRNSDSSDRIQRITSAAAASGVVIYSIDARGLSVGGADASSPTNFDTSGRLLRATAGEMTASQDGLNALASDTGGRGFYNSNALSTAVTTGLKETSAYYLVAWRPDNEEQRNAKSHRIEVNITGRDDLLIRFRRAFGAVVSSEAPNRSKDKPAPARKPPSEELGAALRSPYPKSELPVSITLNFLDVPQYGATLTTSVKVATSSLVLEVQGGPPQAILYASGAIFDDQGKSVSTFNKRFTIIANPANTIPGPPESFFYNYFAIIKPGLYQVRVAALDEKQGRSGSTSRWIQVPDVGSKALTLSSLLVGEKKTDSESKAVEAITNEPDKQPSAFRQVSLNVDHRFARSSQLRFLTFVYNGLPDAMGAGTSAPPASGSSGSAAPSNPIPSTSAGNTSGPDLAVQVQVFRDNEPVITMPLQKIQVEGISDLRRLPYAAELNLEGLQPGRYLLLVTVIDRVAKASASEKFRFQVE